MAKRQFTPKMEAFVRHFSLTGDADAAYRVAYDSLKMEDRTVRAAAAKILAHPMVKSRLADMRADAANTGKPLPKRKAKPTMTKLLTPHQLKFAEAMALGHDATTAYRMAYDASGMVEGSIRSTGSKVSRHKAVRAKIDELKERAAQIAADRFDINLDDVIQFAAGVMKSRPDDYYSWGSRKVPAVNRKTGAAIVDEHGEAVVDDRPYLRVKNSKDLTRRQLAAVNSAELTYSATGQAMLKVATGDRLKAAALLASILKTTEPAPSSVNVTLNNSVSSEVSFTNLTPQEAMKEFERRRAERGLVWASKK